MATGQPLVAQCRIDAVGVELEVTPVFAAGRAWAAIGVAAQDVVVPRCSADRDGSDLELVQFRLPGCPVIDPLWIALDVPVDRLVAGGLLGVVHGLPQNTYGNPHAIEEGGPCVRRHGPRSKLPHTPLDRFRQARSTPSSQRWSGALVPTDRWGRALDPADIGTVE